MFNQISTMKNLFILSFLFVLVSSTLANNSRYRLMLRDDPATTAVIGWDQTSGSNPVVYYDVVDHGTNTGSYAFSRTPDRTVSYKGMDNNFVRLTGLQPNTAYYFVIGDSQGKSTRFWFKTAPNSSSERLSLIAGGDSRNNATPRRNANKLVAKLRPHAVFFGGDMTDNDSNSQWQEWMDDWQLTIGSDGRMIPIVAARGNHEGSNNSIYNLFDVPSSNVYYALTFCNNLFRAYTLNTEISISGNQTSWLTSDLAANSNVVWKMAQYHKPMRPHVSSKSEGNSQYNNWAVPFRDNGVKLVVECDAHTVKTTWPVLPSTGSGSDEGFIRDDANGTVYVGEGCWGAPLRSNNDSKNWTRNSGQFNQFKWIFIDLNQIEVRTIQVDNADQVGTVNDNDIFTPPSNLDIWNPSNGSVVTIQGTGGNFAPSVALTAPANGTHYANAQFVTVNADASDSDGSITKVEFLVDGVLEFTDNSAPYSASVYIDNGSHDITAKAYDDEGATDTDVITVTAGAYSQNFEKRIASSMDDVEEEDDGSMYTNSSDIELVADGSRGNQTIGLRFTGVDVPQGATIDNAYIQFTCDETNSGSTNLTIRAHDTDNSTAFVTSNSNVSSRTTTSAAVVWNPAAWNSVGAATTNERTPELKSIIQEIVDRGGWSANNALSIIITGSGERTAESYDGVSGSAALLHVAYTVGGGGSNQAPSVSITDPVNGSTINAELNDQFTILADASDTDGSIDKVDFYRDGTLIGTDNSAPYSFAETVGSFGNFNYTAVATDDDGATTTSAVINITINEIQTGNCTVTISSFPYSEGFENSLGDWEQSSNDDIDWTLRTGTTPSSNTGPNGAYAGSYYVYVETSNPNYPSKLALLESPCFNLSSLNDAELSFRYHMLGNAVGTLSVEASTNEGASWSTIWSRTATQGSAWNLASIDISSYNSAKFRLRALSGSSWQGDLCVDDLKIDEASSGSQPATFEKRVATGNDDAEEGEDGSMYLTSSDLELVYDSYNSQGNQEVGIRFTNVAVPSGATITNAYIQFTVDETKNDSGVKTIRGEDVDDAPGFSSSDFNISNRTTTSASVNWDPVSWTSTGASGADQRTPDLTSIVQEIVNRGGWSSGNDMVYILSGSGRRVAESYNGSSASAPLLHIEYSAPASRVISNDELEKLDVSGYPNPAMNAYTLANNTEGNIQMTLYNASGEKIESMTIESNETYTFNLENLPDGIYVLKPENYQNQIETIKFVKH